MYLSYSGDGGDQGTGSLMKYDLLTDKVVWQKDYPVGVDSFALTPDGNTMFMPGGEGEGAPWWYVIKTATGRAVARIDGGSYPHNTIVSLDGKRAYLGPRGDPWVTVVDAKTYRVIRKVGPLRESERPFTINRKQTLVFTTASLSRGFQVSSIRTGKVLYTVDFGTYPKDFHISTASHGISLSPDEKQVWVIDAVSNVVRAFDVSGLRRSARGRSPRCPSTRSPVTRRAAATTATAAAGCSTRSTGSTSTSATPATSSPRARPSAPATSRRCGTRASTSRSTGARASPSRRARGRASAAAASLGT